MEALGIWSMAKSPHVNFALEFTRLCRGTEIPELFAVWGGLTAISATLGRRVWLPMGVFDIRPNLFVVLVAASGSFRKSTTINLVEKLLQDVEPPLHFISCNLTPEAFHKSLMGAETELVDPSTGEVQKITEALVIADELAVFLNKRSYERGMATLLINLFDCKGEIAYETLKRGREVVTNACLTLLAGSTADLLRDAVPSDAVGSGLTSRMLFIYTDVLPPGVARPTLSDAQVEMQGRMSMALTQIRAMSGPADLTPEAWELYEKEYIHHRKTSPMMLSPVLSGYASRWHYHTLALSMIMSASENPEQTSPLVDIRHFRAAMTILAASERHMPKVMTLITSTEKGARAELLAMRIGLLEGGVSKKDLLRSVSHKVTLKEFEEAIQTLVASERIKRVQVPGGLIYRRLS